MGDLPAQLEAEWKQRHKVSAEAAFEKVAVDGQGTVGPSFFAATAADPVEA